MKTILPARSVSIWFLNLLERRDVMLKMLSLGASVAGMQDTFVQALKGLGTETVFASTIIGVDP
jgi:hypothetical protein